MQTIELKATKRENLGKSATRQLRKEGKIPCVIYGGKETIHASALLKDFNKLIFTPKVHIINLDLDGQKYNVIIQDVQYHPVTDNAIHADFLQVFDDKPITIEIPVKLNGLAAGVKAGGKLTLEKRKLKVKGLAKNIPDILEIDVTNLGLGKSIQVGELNFENIELLNSSNQVVAAVKLTRAARAAGQQSEGQEA